MLLRVNPIKFFLAQNTKSVYIRHCSTQQSDRKNYSQIVTDKPVRVRFAPSPTGECTGKLNLCVPFGFFNCNETTMNST